MEDGSVFVSSRTNRIFRLSVSGSVIGLIEIHGLLEGSGTWTPNLAGGWFLIAGAFKNADGTGFGCETSRFFRDGSHDPAFTLVAGLPARVFRDGRLLIHRHDGRQILPTDDRPDPAWPGVAVEACAQFAVPGSVMEIGGRLRIRGSICAVNGVYVSGESDANLEFHLSNTTMPRTTLQLAAQGRTAWRRAYPAFDNRFGDPAFPVIFRRLGSRSAPATVHYTMRNLTATTGEDY